MSTFLETVRAKYPAYASVPDDKLALAIGTKYPQYLEHPEFKTTFETAQVNVAKNVKLDAYQKIQASGQQGAMEEGNKDFLTSIANDPKGFLKSLPGDIGAVAGAVGSLPYKAAADAIAKVTGEEDEFGGNLWSQGPGTEKFLAEVSKSNPALATVGKLAQGVAATAPMLAIGGLPAATQKLIVRGFTADMLYHAPGTVKELYTELQKPKDRQDADKVTTLISDAAQQIGFGGLGAAHELKGLSAGLIDKYVPKGQGVNEPARGDARTTAPKVSAEDLQNAMRGNAFKTTFTADAKGNVQPTADRAEAPSGAASESTKNAPGPASPAAAPEQSGPTPALKVGRQIFAGQPGEVYGDIYERVKKTQPDMSGVVEGFIDKNVFRSRDQAAHPKLPTPVEPNKLPSEDIKPAEETPAPAPKLVPVEVSPADVKRAKSATDAPPDILDDIENIHSGPVKLDVKQFGGVVQDARAKTFNANGKPSAATKRLDARLSATKGTPADETLKGLAAENPKYADWTPDQLATAVVEAHARRETPSGDTALARQLAEEEKRTQLFQATALQPRPTAKPLPAEQLFMGDTFKVDGQPMTVTGHAHDVETGLPSHVELEGAYGRQTVPVGQAIHIDKGSLLDANQTQPELIGMGGAVAGEFSPSSIGDVIAPELRAGMAKNGHAEINQTPAQTFLGKFAHSFAGGIHGGEVGRAVRGWLGTVTGRSLPKTTERSRMAGEAGARYAASSVAARPMAQLFATDVLTGLKIDSAKFDAALKADNLLSVREGFLAEAGKFGKAAAEAFKDGDAPKAAKAQFAANQAYENAAKVNTLLGTEGFPFKTEDDLQAYFAEPDVATAIARHKDNWQQVVDPMYKQAAGIDPNVELPSRGKYSSARINLNPIRDGDPLPVEGKIVGAVPGGKLTGTFRRITPFARRATGQGESYVLNYAETIANTFAKQLEIANKREFDDQLVRSGNAVIDDVGKQVTLENGARTKSFPLIRAGQTNKNIYVRESLAKEYAHAADVVLNPYRSNLLARFNQGFAQAALAGLTDATVHVSNLGTTLFQVPGNTGTSLLMDGLLSGAFRADVPVALVRAGSKAAQEFIGHKLAQRPELAKYVPESILASVNKALLKQQSQFASLAEMNATRADHANRIPVAKQLGQMVSTADRVTRLMLSDIYKNLDAQGLVRHSETSYREFVNQAGAYNLRTQGEWMRFIRQTWLSPFVTAGRNFAVQGVRAVTLDPGVKAANAKAAAMLKANMAMKWLGTAMLVGTVNYLITGKLGGRPGVPLGAIDIGKNDENGRPLTFNVMAFTGQSRALRTVGARGAMEALHNGLTPNDAVQAGVRDVVNTATGALAGPSARFALMAASGYSPAINVGRSSAVAPPGDSQLKENLKEALVEANPLVKSAAEYHKPGGTLTAALATQLPRFTLNPGKPASMMQNYPRIVQAAQANSFMEWVIHTARQVPVADNQRALYVNSQIARLPPEFQKRAHAEVQRRRVYATDLNAAVPAAPEPVAPAAPAIQTNGLKAFR